MKKIAILLFNLPIDGALTEKISANSLFRYVFDMMFLGVIGTIRHQKKQQQENLCFVKE